MGKLHKASQAVTLVQIMPSRNLMPLSLSFIVFHLCLAKATVFTKQKETLLLSFSLIIAPCSASLGISHHSFESCISAAPASFPLCFPCFISCFCLLLPTVPLLILLLCPSRRCEHHSSVSLLCSSCFFSLRIQPLPLVYLPLRHAQLLLFSPPPPLPLLLLLQKQFWPALLPNNEALTSFPWEKISQPNTSHWQELFLIFSLFPSPIAPT